ncbi:cytokinin dehydrogenase 3-like [Typha latifolia]|uniref:cytokinin dehydrogenase 3-like n=1 Tax=Typha latifolia TaxID=4733 RepID=UPI003C2D9403
MQTSLHFSQLIALLLPTLLFLLFNFSQSNMISLSPFPSPNLASDYGGIIHNSPIAVLKPKIPEDISLLLKSISSSPAYNSITVAPRGCGHSTYGQAQAHGGVVVDMLSMDLSIQIGETKCGESGGDTVFYVDARGGALWVDVLKETMKHGLTPRSWTDYLYLTVGGTLSVGGISGQAFKYGPQISNVLELDVVTGKGEILTCCKKKNSELFYGVLGGLGQFGIITRARIMLHPAPKMVRWIRISYSDFDKFTTHQELLISLREVDYLEGFVRVDSRSSHDQVDNMFSRLRMNTCTESRESEIYYSVEFAIYYDNVRTVQKKLDQVMSELNLTRSAMSIVDISYFNFLNRVRAEELTFKEKRLWDVAHPWLNLFIPRDQIRRFKDLLIETISDTYIDGPIIIYPTLRHKWNQKMSVVLPPDDTREDIMYIASVLRAAPPSCNTLCLKAFLLQNQMIIDIATGRPGSHATLISNECRKNVMDAVEFSTFVELKAPMCDLSRVEVRRGGMGGKQYMPYYQNEVEWQSHFGVKWERFKKLKSKFDPLNILTPGQRIFERKHIQAN